MLITEDDIGKIGYFPEWRQVDFQERSEFWIVKILGIAIPESEGVEQMVICDHIAMTFGREVIHRVENDMVTQSFLKNLKFITLLQALALGCPPAFFTPVEIAQAKSYRSI